jgi:hypothetical protein
MKSKAFAGIGACNTPNTPALPIGTIMGKTANILALQRGWCMTSSGQIGADQFFSQGLQVNGRDALGEGLFKMFLPEHRAEAIAGGIVLEDATLLQRARQLLIEHNVYRKVPRFIALEGDDRKSLSTREQHMAALHALRVFQVLQETLEQPVNMVICWTPDGAISREQCQIETTGGAGIAIALADGLGIPVFNLQREDHLSRICEFIGEPLPNLKP